MPDSPQIQLPPQPRGVKESRLPSNFIADLVIKVMYFNGAITGEGLSERTRLNWLVLETPVKFLMEQKHCESTGVDENTARDLPFSQRFTYELTAAGKDKARELIAVNQYAGPAPVPLDVYTAVAAYQARQKPTITRDVLERALSNLVLPPSLIDNLGPGLNARQPIFLYGPPGNGKSTIASVCAKLMGGPIFIPHAIFLNGEVIRLFDPTHHHALPISVSTPYDQRWVLCSRPMVAVGGEMTKEALDLAFDPHLGFYEASLQMKANGGMFLIDDFGRQQLKPAEILNRLIVCLETGYDLINVARVGTTVKVPFDEILMLSTNLDPKDLMDGAFLRRIHYKVEVGNPSPEAYGEIFARVCRELGISFQSSALEYLIQHHYRDKGRDLHGCEPRDILNHLRHVANYQGVAPTLSRDLIDRAVSTYFANLGDD